jgi:peptidoglycan-associated lipoprotein
MNSSFHRLALLVTVLATTHGCSTTPPPTPEKKTAISMPVSPLVQHLIFFNFDDKHSPKDTKEIIAPHVRYLVQNPTKRLLIEGHADEKGTKQYNLQLGQERALAIFDEFVSEGIDENQLIMRSKGENNPLNMQNQHERNRRVQLVY